jgi:hypothetical protein
MLERKYDHVSQAIEVQPLRITFATPSRTKHSFTDSHLNAAQLFAGFPSWLLENLCMEGWESEWVWLFRMSILFGQQSVSDRRPELLPLPSIQSQQDTRLKED